MAESFVNVTEGSGKKLHTFNKTVGANDVHDEVVIAGVPYLATYAAAFTGISLATAASHVIQVMAGGTLPVYILEIKVWQLAAATTAAFVDWSVRRLTTAGTGGTSTTPQAFDGNDSASGATAMTLPTAKGTEGGVPIRQAGYLTQTPGAAGVMMLPVFEWTWDRGGLSKPIRISAGTANGIALRNDTGHAAATVTGYVRFIEATF